jgi:hypothetical protein
LLVLNPAAVAADQLHPRTRQLDVEHSGIRGVGQPQTQHLAGLGG